MVVPILAQELLDEKNPVKPFAEKILSELKLTPVEKKEVGVRRRVKVKKVLEEFEEVGAPLRKLTKKLLTPKKKSTKKLTARERRILRGLRKKKFTAIERFGRSLVRQKQAKQLRPRPQQVSPLSSDNRHERRLRSLQNDSDDYERHLRNSQVPENYFLRKMRIAKRRRLLQREFARKNNLLARQQEMPRETFKVIDEDFNILKPVLNIMEKTPNSISINEKRQFNILQTKEAGNSLHF